MDKTMIAPKRMLGVLAGMLSLVLLSAAGPARAERKGAEVSILRIDGTVVEGELIAVQGETLILLVADVDASVKLEEISSLAVHKRSKAREGMVHGDTHGIKAGAQSGTDPGESDQALGRRVLSRNSTSTEAAANVLIALLRAVADAKTSREEVYLLPGIKPESQKREFLRHLDGLARVRSAR
jgi:hypothetical protein